jgi:hypothetical protein
MSERSERIHRHSKVAFVLQRADERSEEVR